MVGVSGGDIKIYVKHMRKKELRDIADESGAEVVYLEDAKDKSGKKA